MKDIYAAPSEGYVYVWTNLINGKRYVGSHNGSDPNYKASGRSINKAFKKYGIGAFERAIVYQGPHYREAETLIIRVLDCVSDRSWYNQAHIHGTYECSDDVKAKISAGLRGKRKGPPSATTRAKIAAGKRGSVCSQETKDKITASKMGQRLSQETKDKIAANKIGKAGPKHTPESRAKIAEASRLMWEKRRSTQWASSGLPELQES